MSWRAGGIFNALIAVALCAAVVLVALPARQTEPLTVAELAPRAVQTQVDGAEQAEDTRRTPRDEGGDRRGSDNGDDGDGNGAGDGRGTGGTEKAENAGGDRPGSTDDERGTADDPDDEGERDDDPDASEGEAAADGPARRRRCVGTPPRQTEDPQSPPCVAGSEFDASNNGGATAPGVTADEIRIAYGGDTKYRAGLEGHFNTRYELHGRRLRLVAFASGPNSLDGAVADAVEVAEDVKAFATTNYRFRDINDAFYDELARRGVISVHARALGVDSGHLRSRTPYRWSVLPPRDDASAMQADYVCTSLKGGRANEAGGVLRTQTRRFGLITSLRPDGSTPDVGPLRERLQACGVELAVDRTISDAAGQGETRQAVLALQRDGVTTVIQQTSESGEIATHQAATSQLYTPEWLLSPAADPDDTDTIPGFYDTVQLRARFGPNWLDKPLPLADEPAFQALREGDPAVQVDAQTRLGLELAYRSLLVIASGIQAAGPNLTPQTFADGLQSSGFPNPGAGAAPSFQAAWSFSGDFSAVSSAALSWISQTAVSNETGLPGAICFARDGRRYDLGGFPSDDGGVGEGGCQ